MKAYPESTLPLYNEQNVAQLQRFFGLELAAKTAEECVQKTVELPNNGNDVRVDDKDRGITYFQLKHRKSGEAHESCNGDAGSPAPVNSEEANANPRERYHVGSWFWYCVFSFGAALGDDLFYFFVFPFAIANMSWWVIRRLLMVWGFCMFIGQASKEILQWPRPSEPPVIRLEKRYFKEYGMPSTHAMVGTLVPFTLLVSTWNHYEYPHMLGIVLACNWTLLVCCSRLYRGMHFMLDIVAGVTLTCLLMALIWPWLDMLDHFQLTHPYAPVIIIIVTLLLCILYPALDGVGATRKDTISILGAMAGGSSAFWFNYHNGILPDADGPLGGVIMWPDMPTAGVMFVKYALVKVCAIILFFGTKFLVKKFFYYVVGIEVNEETKKLLIIQIPYGYIPHWLTMIIGFQLGPWIYRWLGLE
ncbi:sphingosine-1-phosphate phosphatase 2-like [Asterias rubens]|uniref:sphingosine-1-phosphate phosphatase 2-like n=1 Tax=Asterias rubens TaxID=7604 RepID=UPI001455CA95|nr:sphingosine-1-phosphate phosphatase 2-like [Asterias rubens]